MKTELRRFTREDWYGLAGAEPLTDGSEPLIGNLDAPDGVLLITGENGAVAAELLLGDELNDCWRVAIPSCLPLDDASLQAFVNLLSIPTEEAPAGWTRF